MKYVVVVDITCNIIYLLIIVSDECEAYLCA